MSEPTAAEVAERFALKSLDLAKMTGISLAVHATSDAFLLQHTGVGCKYKAAAQTAQHDWGEHPNRREGWTQVGEVSLIKGAAERIGPFARTWYERRRPGFMIVVTAFFIELTGDASSDYVADLAKTLPCPVALISTVAPNQGFFGGYGAVILAMAKTLDWKAAAAHPKRVTVVGQFFHRYEGDQLADVVQLQGLIAAAGLEVGPIFLSGAPWKELSTAAESGIVLELPYMKPVTRKLKRIVKKRTHVQTDMPIGLSGTARFLRELAAGAGLPMGPVEARIERELAAVQERLVMMKHHQLRHTVAFVFADTPLAAGLCTILVELGVPIELVGLRDTSLGGERAFRETLERNGVQTDARVLEQPSLAYIRDKVVSRTIGLRGAIVIGSSHELGVFTHRPHANELHFRGVLLETGMPSNQFHTVADAPTLGFQGVLTWAQRILGGMLAPRFGRG